MIRTQKFPSTWVDTVGEIRPMTLRRPSAPPVIRIFRSAHRPFFRRAALYVRTPRNSLQPLGPEIVTKCLTSISLIAKLPLAAALLDICGCNLPGSAPHISPDLCGNGLQQQPPDSHPLIIRFMSSHCPGFPVLQSPLIAGPASVSQPSRPRELAPLKIGLVSEFCQPDGASISASLPSGRTSQP